MDVSTKKRFGRKGVYTRAKSGRACYEFLTFLPTFAFLHCLLMPVVWSAVAVLGRCHDLAGKYACVCYLVRVPVFFYLCLLASAILMSICPIPFERFSFFYISIICARCQSMM